MLGAVRLQERGSRHLVNVNKRTLQLHLVLIRLGKGMLGAWEHWVREAQQNFKETDSNEAALPEKQPDAGGRSR